MEIEFLEQFDKDLDKIYNAKLKIKITKLIEQIESTTKLSDLSNVKKITGHKSAYRFKLGNYRLGFYFENNIIEFARLLHRKDIYRLFP